MNEFELWYEKYRPRNLDDYVWVSGEFKQRVMQWVQEPGKLPHLILAGSPGTGKTTLATILSNTVTEDPECDILYINTNRSSGVAAIREDVTNFCTSGGFGGLKVVLIDEADGLSIPAQDKLRAVINDYGSFVRFIFTCNKIRSMSEALKSRARVVEVAELDVDEFISRLEYILDQEKVTYEPTVIGKIVEATFPDLRKAIDTLQDCVTFNNDQCVLSNYSDIESVAPEWQEGVSAAIVNGATVATMRELTSSLKVNEVVDVYQYITEYSGKMFEDQAKEMASIVIVKNNLIHHDTVAFPQILLLGCLIELMQLQNEQ
jgi:DNA polymerase III delta prime subunit